MTVTKLNGIAQDALATTLKSNATTTLGKNEFLKLLIAQLKNQDPMSPMDSYEFAAHLAQFTSVEQLMNINNTLDDNLNLDLLLTQAINNTLSISIIGKQVIGYGNNVFLKEGNGEISFNLNDFAYQVKVKIFDESGKLVREIQLKNLQAGFQSVNWDGLDNKGVKVNDGKYTFSVEAYDLYGNQVGVTTLVSGTASGVRYDNGKAYLLVNGMELPFSQVIEVKDIHQNGGGL